MSESSASRNIELSTHEEKNRAEEAPATLFHLPGAVLLHTLSFLSPETMAQVARVNSVAKNTVVTSGSYWKAELQRYFPHVLKKDNSNSNLYTKFKETYKKEYEGLLRRDKNFLRWVKEGNIGKLKNTYLGFNELFSLCDNRKFSLIDWAAITNNQRLLDYFYELAIENYSVKNGVNIEKEDYDGMRILHWAVICNQPKETVEAFILQGANVNQTARGGLTALHCAAAYNNRTDLVECLLAKGANIEAAGTYGRTALHLAVQWGHANIVKLLLEKGAYINATTHAGSTPLHFAAQIGHLDSAKLLLEKGANINAITNTDRSTPLHLSAFYGHLATAKLLLEKGADTHATENNGCTALAFARQRGHTAIAQALSSPLLDNYLDKVNRRADNDYTTYRLCGFTFNLRFFGACSAGEKKAAAVALKNVVDGKASRYSLFAHEKALAYGELGAIYQNIRQSREREILKKCLSNKR